MKKLLALLLALVMMICFAACTSTVDEEEVRGEQSVIETSSIASESEPEFSLGNIEGLTYENKFIGLGCVLDDDWTFYTDEQINDLNNVTADMAGEEYQELIENASIVYDMYATNVNMMDNINVNLEKTNPISLAVLDLAENFENAFSTIKETYENMGYTDVTYKIGTVTIDGEEFTSMSTTAQINGITMYQTLFAVKCNGYLANITVTTFQEDTVDSILSKFYLVK